ncbi:MAG: CDP-diacylglycerol--serine O-phosphatidyltransferase [Pirellulales bacterium]
MKPIRAIAVLPTLFTLGNLICGFFAIVVLARIEKPTDTTQFAPAPKIEFKMQSAQEIRQSARDLIDSDDPTHNLMLCGALILLAMIFDAVDGQVARITRGQSDFGAQLDSLCDLVSFGLAPAILLVKMCPQFTSLHNDAIWMIAAVFACCAALRLARFNVETDDEDDHSMFAGLPTPAAAATIASFAMLSYFLRNETNVVTHENFVTYDWWMQRIVPFFAIVIAILMVSRVPYPHPLTQFVRGQRSFAHLVAIIFAVSAILIVRNYAIPLLCVLFVLAPPVRYAWDLVWHRRSRNESLF